jgi:hypothetical protein
VKQSIKIGGASGYWGDWDGAAASLLDGNDLDYLVFDYLAEITMSIMARARAQSPDKGYATDFIGVIRSILPQIERTGVKVLSNAGGVNPTACADALRAAIAEAGIDLTVAVVTGDDLMPIIDTLTETREMFSGAPFPPHDRILSANAYLGAGPVATALRLGADIVITGRGVDSALTLGACLHEFDWALDDWDLLSTGSLAGHLLECGAQVSGGNFTDWETLATQCDQIGYPVIEITAAGDIEVSTSSTLNGRVSIGTVAEQMLYEIGDPQRYVLPDVICDFSQVTFAQRCENRVHVSGAKGRPAPDAYKCSVTYSDGWKIAMLMFFVGENAEGKARDFGQAALSRTQRRMTRHGVPDFSETLIELFGNDSHFGAYADNANSREVAVKVAAKHDDPKPLGWLLKDAMGLALAAPPGIAIFSGARPKPSPLVRLFSMRVGKSAVRVSVHGTDQSVDWNLPELPDAVLTPPAEPMPPEVDAAHDALIKVPLRQLAWGRSGDKGDKANIGIIARKPDYLPWIWAQLTTDFVADRFAHFLQGEVERFYLPGSHAVNLLLHDVLGGGGTVSLRNDPQGKTYAQILLDAPIAIPEGLSRLA